MAFKSVAQIEKDYPTSCALEWDNVGLLAGRMDKEVKRVYIGLDATDPVIREAADRSADSIPDSLSARRRRTATPLERFRRRYANGF